MVNYIRLVAVWKRISWIYEFRNEIHLHEFKSKTLFEKHHLLLTSIVALKKKKIN